MAKICDAQGKHRVLQSEQVIGRAPSCALRIEESYVSAQHATVRWTGDHWELKDLGSRNGTFLDGERIAVGCECRLRIGARLGFGKSAPEWVLADDSAPIALVVPLDSSDPIAVEGDLLALPSAEDPQVTIYRDTDGSWLIEYQDDATTPITNGQTFEAGDGAYRFCDPEAICRTSIEMPESEVSQVRLTFSVSGDEEHVELQADCRAGTFDLGARGHNYLLLTLARRRLEDASSGLPETSCGWVYQEDFAHDTTMSGHQLNIDVYRVRKQFAALPITNAASIIQRRPRTRQLRIGTGQLSIVTL